MGGDGSPLEERSAAELLELLRAADTEALEAVARAGPALARAVDAFAEAWRRGGRLVYVGAGTSGRIGALDAAECPPTFGAPAARVIALVAGGRDALARAVEAAEDDEEAGRRAVTDAGVGEADLVVGLSASGTTPFTCAALEEAATLGAFTVAITGKPRGRLVDAVDLPVVLEVGDEPVEGSTRMKAGTAQKLACNSITTAGFIRLGRVVGRRMVAVQTGSAKLHRRAVEILRSLAGVGAGEAEALLERAGGDLPVALVMAVRGLGAQAARDRLEETGGDVPRAMQATAGQDMADSRSPAGGGEDP